jgi:FixJ family two-component response regulator
MLPRSILVVDDDQAICELVRDGLAGRSYSCDIANNADEAVAKFKNRRYDVALLDIRLPGISGMQLLTLFKSISRDIKILMVTAVRDLGTAVQAMKLGASDYIVKPFTMDKLNANIEAVLERAERRTSAAEQIADVDFDLKNADVFSSAIMAIAHGVDAQVDYFDCHSKIVTERTVDIARRLDLPAQEIEEWIIARNNHFSRRDRYIRSSLEKLERSSVGRLIFGLAHSVFLTEE